MSRGPQANPRLMPYGYGNRSVICAGPCDQGPINIRLTDPMIPRPENKCADRRGPQPSYEEAIQNISCYDQGQNSKSPCPTPINVNLKMCQMNSSRGDECQQQMGGNYRQGQNQDCFSACKTPPRPPRCPDGNFAERAVSMRPNMNYEPSPFVFDDRTTYKTFYHPKMQHERTKMFKPTHVVHTSGAKLEDQSLYKLEFPPFPTIPYQKPIWAKVEEFVPNEGAVSGVTSYKSAYQGGSGRPAESTKPIVFLDPNRAQLDDRTTYKTDYNPFCPDQYGKRTTKDKLVATPCVPFRHVSTYKTDYIKMIGKPRKSLKREPISLGEKVGQTGSTTYKTEFEPFYFNKRCEKIDIPTKHYDQIYPRNTCDCIDCCPYYEQTQEPLVPPSPPCPNGQEPPCVNENYKVKVTNEDNEFAPTQINVTTTPAVYTPCCSSCM